MEYAFKKPIPTSLVMRERYTDRLFEETKKKMIERIGDGPICVTLDEYTDSSLRSLGAFVVSSLNRPDRGPYLLNINEMEGGKNEHIIDFFENSLKVLYPNGNLFIK